MAGAVCVVMPRVGSGLASSCCPAPLVLSCSPRVILVSLPLCVWWHDAMRGGEGGVCYEWRGVWVWGCVLFCSSPFSSLCLLSQHCWFVVCFCDRVVSLWNGGVRWCGGCVVLVVSSSPFSSLVLVFGVVRAQLCEHARYPRTPLCFRPIVVFSFLLRPASLFSCVPLFFLHRFSSVCLEWRCVFTMCRSVRWA